MQSNLESASQWPRLACLDIIISNQCGMFLVCRFSKLDASHLLGEGQIEILYLYNVGARGPCTTSFVLYDGIGYPELVAGSCLGKEWWGTFTLPPWWPVRMIELFVCHLWSVSW